MPHVFHGKPADERAGLLERTVGYGFKGTVRQQSEHVARGVVGADELAVADDHAVMMRAVIVRVDRQHGACASGHEGERFKIARGRRGMKTGSVAQLNVGNEADGGIFFDAVERNGKVVILIGIIIRRVDAGRVPGAVLRVRDGREP